MGCLSALKELGREMSITSSLGCIQNTRTLETATANTEANRSCVSFLGANYLLQLLFLALSISTRTEHPFQKLRMLLERKRLLQRHLLLHYYHRSLHQSLSGNHNKLLTHLVKRTRPLIGNDVAKLEPRLSRLHVFSFNSLQLSIGI